MYCYVLVSFLYWCASMYLWVMLYPGCSSSSAGSSTALDLGMPPELHPPENHFPTHSVCEQALRNPGSSTVFLGKNVERDQDE